MRLYRTRPAPSVRATKCQDTLANYPSIRSTLGCTRSCEDHLMGIAVYPRLNELLRAHDLSVAELERRIERRFGLQVDPKTLYRLTHTDPIQRADLEIAGAVAEILGVGLDDIFDVQVTPTIGDEAQASSDLTS